MPHSGVTGEVIVSSPSALDRRQAKGPLLMILPAFVLLLGSFILPYIYMIYMSFLTHAATRTFAKPFTLKNYVEALNSPYNWQVFGRTFTAAALITITCLVLGYPIAYHIAHLKGRM